MSWLLIQRFRPKECARGGVWQANKIILVGKITYRPIRLIWPNGQIDHPLTPIHVYIDEMIGLIYANCLMNNPTSHGQTHHHAIHRDTVAISDKCLGRRHGIPPGSEPDWCPQIWLDSDSVNQNLHHISWSDNNWHPDQIAKDTAYNLARKHLPPFICRLVMKRAILIGMDNIIADRTRSLNWSAEILLTRHGYNIMSSAMSIISSIGWIHSWRKDAIHWGTDTSTRSLDLS